MSLLKINFLFLKRNLPPGLRLIILFSILNVLTGNFLHAQPPQKLFYSDWTVIPGKIYYSGASGEQIFYEADSGRIYYTAVGPDGAVYFSDANKNKLKRWTGTFTSTIYTHTTYLRDIAFDPQGNLYFSESSGAMSDGKIYRLDDGTPTLFYTVTLTSVGGFWAGNFAFASDGTLYLTTGNRRGANVYRVTGGNPASVYNDPDGSIDGFDIDAAGNIYYADWFSNIYMISPDGMRTNVINNAARRFADVCIVKVSVGIGPEAGRVNNVATHPSNPNILYAGTSTGGVFRTYNGGRTWNWIGAGMTNSKIGGVLVYPEDPNIIFASTPSGIFRSSNQGSNWSLAQAVTMPLPPLSFAREVASLGELQSYPIRYNSGDRAIYAAPFNSGLYKSTNRGTDWTSIYNAPDPFDKYVTSVDFSPESGGSVFISTPNGVKQSIAGATFNRITADTIDPIGLNVAPSMMNRLYVATCKIGNPNPDLSLVLRRDAAGGPFMPGFIMPPYNGYFRTISVCPTNADLLYIGSGNLLRSTNAGGSWVPALTGCGSICGADYRGITFNSSGNILYAAHDQGIFKYESSPSRPDTGIFTAIEEGLVNTQYYCMDVGSGGTIYAGSQDFPPYWKLGTSGWTGMDCLGFADIHDIVVDPTDDSHVFYLNIGDYVMRSTDRGRVAIMSNRIRWPHMGTNHQLVYYQPSGTLFAGTMGGGVYKSTDNGITLNPANTGIENLRVRCIANQPGSDQFLYTGSLTQGVYKTTNGGGGWQRLVSFPEQGAVVIAIKEGGDRVYAGTSHGVYLSTDGGSTWAPRNTGLPESKVISELMIDPLCSCAIYAGLGFYDEFSQYEGGIYQSTDGGNSWTRLSSDREHSIPITSIKIDPTDRSRLIVSTFGAGIRILFRDIPGRCVCP